MGALVGGVDTTRGTFTLGSEGCLIPRLRPDAASVALDAYLGRCRVIHAIGCGPRARSRCSRASPMARCCVSATV